MNQEKSDEVTGLLSKTTAWFDLAKNLAWIIGLVAILLYKFQEVQSAYENQAEKIQYLIQERRECTNNVARLEGEINKIYVLITEIKTQHEIEKRLTTNERR